MISVVLLSLSLSLGKHWKYNIVITGENTLQTFVKEKICKDNIRLQQKCWPQMMTQIQYKYNFTPYDTYKFYSINLCERENM